MSITTTGNLPAPILQSLAPGMLSGPTPNFNYIIPAEKYSMPRQGGTTMRFLRPVPLVAPVVQPGDAIDLIVGSTVVATNSVVVSASPLTVAVPADVVPAITRGARVGDVSVAAGR